jgi:putative transposon-encoded protein
MIGKKENILLKNLVVEYFKTRVKEFGSFWCKTYKI